MGAGGGEEKDTTLSSAGCPLWVVSSHLLQAAQPPSSLFPGGFS